MASAHSRDLSSLSPRHGSLTLPELGSENRCTIDNRPARLRGIVPATAFRELDPGYGRSPRQFSTGACKSTQQRGIFREDSIKLLPKLLTSLATTSMSYMQACMATG